MKDYCLLSFKVGDQIVDPLNPHLGYKDGDLISCDIPSEWGLIELEPGKLHRTAFATIKRPIAEKDFWRQFTKHETDDKTGLLLPNTNWRKRVAGINLSQLAEKLGIAGIESAWREEGREVDIIESSISLVDIIRYNKDLIFDKVIEDLNAITSGDYTVGSGGGYDYLTLVTAEADMGTLSGDMSLTHKTDTTLSAVCNFNNAFANHTLTVTSDTDPLGNPNDGWEISIAHNSHGIHTTFTGLDPTICIEKLKLKRTTAGSASSSSLLLYQAFGETHLIRKMFLDGNGLQGTGILAADSGASIKMTTESTSIRDCVGGGVGYWFFDGDGQIVKNLLIEGCTTGVDGTALSGTITNVASGNNTTDFFDVGGLTADFCLSEDGTGENADFGTGTNCDSTITLSDEFYLDDTQTSYAQQKAAGTVSTTDPSVALMDGAWTDEIGPKVREAGATGGPPLGSLNLLGVGR